MADDVESTVAIYHNPPLLPICIHLLITSINLFTVSWRVARIENLKFVGTCGAESISLRYVSGKYRETEGAPGSVDWAWSSWAFEWACKNEGQCEEPASEGRRYRF